MNKRLTLIAAGALAALAFAALPGAATAKETKLKCEGAGSCTFTVSGGVTNISIAGGDTVKCERLTGSGEVPNLNAERESTTDLIIITLENCKEQNTVW